ncbi:hypothetical protein CRE_16386 [Caenorhabditis remanei]|uniref:Uncharacterized protein n=1 Tax=Caenorhabditis remanei TaxID=31234 RepID=E3NC51_CAERE|nr:hypothetical protein CRE_16386 [Caenorhabditis remanei]
MEASAPPPPPPPPPSVPPPQPADAEVTSADLQRQIQEMMSAIGQLKQRTHKTAKARTYPERRKAKEQRQHVAAPPTCSKCGNSHATHECSQVNTPAEKLYLFLREGFCLRCSKRHHKPCRSSQKVCEKCGERATVVHSQENCFMD